MAKKLWWLNQQREEINMKYKLDYGKVSESSSDPVPKGKYNVEIIKLETTETSKGDPMIRLRTKILNGLYKGRIIFDQIVLFPPDAVGAGFTKHFLHVIGEPFEGDSLDVNTDRWLGKRYTVVADVDEQYNSNKVKSRDFLDDIPF